MANQMELTLESVKLADNPCRCENCGNWVSERNLHPINGSINEKAFGLANRSKDVNQTVWICNDCYDLNN